MRVLLTGRTGFIGGFLHDKLVAEGHEVFSLVRHVAGRYQYLPDEKGLVFGELRDFARIKEIMNELQPEIVLNLAAMTAVSLSFQNPIDFWETTASGTINLAECARSNPKLKLFIHASTSEVYGTQPVVPFKETFPYNPTSPYAVAKVADEYYLHMMGMVYSFPFVIMRPFNTYGRMGIKHYVVERATTTLLEKGEVQLWNPASIRDFLYVDDHANGYLAAIKNAKAGETYNICTGRGVSIKEMVDIVMKEVAEQFGIDPKVNWHLPEDRPYEIKILIGDNTKAKTDLKWEPKVTLEEGLKKTVAAWGQLLGTKKK